jgi:hypothetical protein
MSARREMGEAFAGMDAAFKRRLEEAPPRFIGRHADVVTLDLALEGWSVPALTQKCYGIRFLINGSNPDARLDLEANGGWTAFAPGDWIYGAFDGLTIRRSPITGAATEGSARLLLLRDPDVRAGQTDRDAAGLLSSMSVAKTANGIQQARNEASANEPDANTPGVSLAGVRGFRVYLIADAAETFVSGTIRGWAFKAGLDRWAATPIEYDVAAAVGRRDYQFADEIPSVPEGLIYFEADTVLTSGAGNLYVVVETWA